MPISCASVLRQLKDLSWRLLGCEPAFAGCLLAAQLWLGLLWFFYQGSGVARGIILCALLIGLLALRLYPRGPSAGRRSGTPTLTPVLRVLLVLVVLLDAGMMAVSSTTSFHTSRIPMDEGVTSWRAARLLWRGENPYAAGALVDFGAFHSRAPQRAVAGISAPEAGEPQTEALAHYDTELDPAIRNKLLPAPRQTNAAAARETRLYGYKYGPILLLVTALVVPLGVPAAVLILNGFACFAMFAADWQILRRLAAPQLALAGVALLALLLDRHITRNYIDRSATDVWALLFGSLAVLACMTKRPLAAAAAVALAVGCKSMPGLLFAPLLLRFRAPAPILLFAAIAGALYLPWLIPDPLGVTYNVFLWPFFMATDYTSWQYFAPPWAAFAARAVAAGALIVLWARYLLGREKRLCWTLAMSSTLVLLASGFLRNGYVPWASIWVVAAIVEAFKAPVEAAPPLSKRTAGAG